jgi:hypothetical protein
MDMQGGEIEDALDPPLPSREGFHIPREKACTFSKH